MTSAVQTPRESLVELSLLAAVELERALAREPINDSTIVGWLKALGNAISSDPSAGLVDPQYLSAYGLALNQLGQARVTTAQEIQRTVGELMKKCSGTVIETPQDVVAQLRDFCLALHKELLAASVTEHFGRGRRHNEPGAAAAAY